MKKFLKLLLISVLALATALTMVACDGAAPSGSGKKGVDGAVTEKGIYEVRKYYAEDGVDTLDLGAIKLPEGVTEIKIKANAFAGNTSLKSIKVPSHTVEIGAGAFAKMVNLEKIELPFVGAEFNANYKHNSSESVTISDSERTIAHIFGADEYDGGSQVTVNYGASTTTVYIPLTLKTVIINNAKQEEYNIPMYAFNGVTAFTNIELKGKIVGIGENAFGGVGGIETIKIPASVKTIYAGAFAGCYIKNFVFDNGCSNIKVEENAFFGCTLLNFVGAGTPAKNTIDLSKVEVSTIGRSAFDLSDNEVKYTVKNASGVNTEKVFGETKLA